MMRLKPLWLLCLMMLTFALLLARPKADWSGQDRQHLLASSSYTHPTGTDFAGRDRLTRISMAGLLSLTFAAVASCVTVLIAALVGSWIGLAPPYARSVAFLLCDTILCLPLLFLFMVARSTLPLNLSPATSALATLSLFCLLSWPGGARLLAARSFEAKASSWMLYAQATGISRTRILVRFVVPYLKPLLLAEFITSLPVFILTEANLGMLGLGVGEPLPSFGNLLRELNDSTVFSSSSWSLLPVAVLMLVVALLQALSLEGDCI